MLNSDLSPAAPQGRRELPTDKTCVVSTHRQVPTNWVSGRTLQPSIESVVANSFAPSDFLVDGQVSGLGTVHPLLTVVVIVIVVTVAVIVVAIAVMQKNETPLCPKLEVTRVMQLP